MSQGLITKQTINEFYQDGDISDRKYCIFFEVVGNFLTCDVDYLLLSGIHMEKNY